MSKFSRIIKSSAIAFIIVFGSFGAIAAITHYFGDLCWAPRIGGTMIGIVVFVQGYIAANLGRFSRKDGEGIAQEQHIMHFVYLALVFGTFLWAFGDLIPSLYGVKLCHAR
jgi:hypothetical protein